MKAGSLNRPALSWLQGGHQTAPQYRSTGLPLSAASANASSTSRWRRAMAVAGAGASAELAVATGAGVQALSAEASSNTESATRIGSISKGGVTGHCRKGRGTC
ncbi:hypothetical protein G6F68_012887 [Rhizopus microsporus]|nr:hypothetical protein G6F68_012887 [Rhizopus microsporus]